MSMVCRCALAASLAAGWFSTAGMVSAAPPLTNLISFSRIDADPNNPYTLTDRNGPWLIMATTFHGPNAAGDAQKLVYELRRQFKLTAYTHQAAFQFAPNRLGSQAAPTDNLSGPRYRRNGRVEEVAVLVGDFDAVDDKNVAKVLDRIKTMKPEALGGEKPSSQAFAAFRALPRKLLLADGREKEFGPMKFAFVTTNPLIPESYFRPKGMDRLIVEMNSGVEHSLLNCRGKYTIKVATFNGNVVIDPQRVEELKKNKNAPMKSRLVAAAEKAHDLTVYLRASHIEAYEFHDRHSSIVTVGSFASIGTCQPDGTVNYSPEVQAVIDSYKAQPIRLRNGSLGPITPGYIKYLKIYLDPLPVAIEVPQQSLGSDYVQRPLTVTK